MAAENKNKPVGLIAGSGRVPFLVADGIRKAGRKLVIIGMKGLASERLVHMADEFRWVGLTRLGSWLSILRQFNVHEAVMIGG
ncbi:MAG: DUF1009 domain-containing protein, partial [Planctomycetaceae bacterium]